MEALHACRHGYYNDNHLGIPCVLLVKSQVKMPVNSKMVTS